MWVLEDGKSLEMVKIFTPASLWCLRCGKLKDQEPFAEATKTTARRRRRMDVVVAVLVMFVLVMKLLQEEL